MFKKKRCDSSETIKVSIIKLGTLTASDMRIHHVLVKVTQILIVKIINV